MANFYDYIINDLKYFHFEGKYRMPNAATPRFKEGDRNRNMQQKNVPKKIDASKNLNNNMKNTKKQD